MARYVIRRSLWVMVVVAVITLTTFLIFYVMPPSDPAVAFAGKQPTPEIIAEVRAQLGLDQPLYVQYGRFVKHIFLGDEHGWPGFGLSYNTRAPIVEELFRRLTVTAQMAVGAAFVWLVMGLSIGIVSALKRRTLVDRAAMGFALFGVSAPVFWLGLMALFLFWQQLGLTAGTGYVPPGESLGEWLSDMVLPWTVLALLYAALYARMVRTNLIEAMGEDYIRTARAKGLSERRVVAKHGLRASTHTGGDDLRHRLRHPSGRSDHHRNGVQHAGSRNLRSGRGVRRRPAGDPRRHRVRIPLRYAVQLFRRHRLRLSRPARPLRVMEGLFARQAGASLRDVFILGGYRLVAMEPDTGTDDAAQILGLLAEPERLRVVAALVLGYSGLDDIARVSGVPRRAVSRALARLVAGGLVDRDEPIGYRVAIEELKVAARRAATVQEEEDEKGSSETGRVLRSFVRGGRLKSIPAARSKRRIVLDHLAQEFEPGRRYPEREVNAVLAAHHDDVATLRRLLVDEGFMERERGRYWRTGGTFDVD
jgi:peptide/nickel transport system permease protein